MKQNTNNAVSVHVHGIYNALVSEVYAHANDKRSHKISAPENRKELKERLHLKKKDKVEIYKWNFYNRLHTGSENWSCIENNITT